MRRPPGEVWVRPGKGGKGARGSDENEIVPLLRTRRTLLQFTPRDTDRLRPTTQTTPLMQTNHAP